MRGSAFLEEAASVIESHVLLVFKIYYCFLPGPENSCVTVHLSPTG